MIKKVVLFLLAGMILTTINCNSSRNLLKKSDLPIDVKFYPEEKWQTYEMSSGYTSLRYKQLFDAHWKLRPYGYPLNSNPFVEILRNDSKGKFSAVTIVGEVEVNAVNADKIKSFYLNAADEFFQNGKMKYYVGKVKNVGYLFYEKRIWDAAVEKVEAGKEKERIKAEKLKQWEKGWDRKNISQKIIGKWSMIGMNCNYLGECRDWSEDGTDFWRFHSNGKCSDTMKQSLRYILQKKRSGLDLIIVKNYFNDGRNLVISVIQIKPDSMILEFPDENNNSGVFYYERVE